MKSTPSTDKLPGWLQWSIFGGLALILVTMPFHAFISTWGGTAIGPLEAWKSWKEVLLVMLAAGLVVWLSMRLARWKTLLSDPLAWWILAFVFVLALQSLVHFQTNGLDATLAGLAMSGRYLLIFTIAYTLFMFGNWNLLKWPDIRRYAAEFLLAIGIFISVIGVIQVHVLPNDFLSQFGYDKDSTIAPATFIDDNPDALRAFATLRGPNDFGAFLILPLLVSLIAATRNKWWLVGTAVILFALFESASRSAWVGAFIAMTALIAMTYGKSIITSRKWQIGIAGAAVAAVLVGVAAMNIPSVRLEIFHSSPGDASLTEGSTDNHWKATSEGVNRVASNPLGCGAGCSGPASYYGDNPKIAENYYVQIAEETGISGLILWIGIAVMVAVRLWRRHDDYLARVLLATFIGISAIGLWLHVWVDDPLSLTWWLLAGITLGYYSGIGYDNRKLNKTKKKHDRQNKTNAQKTRH